MKNFLFLITLGLFLYSSHSFSQESTKQSQAETESVDNQEKSKSSEKPYDRWSIEFNFGTNRTDDYYNSGFYQTDIEKDLALGGLGHYDLGVRYMLNEKFGLKFSGSYDIFDSNSDNSSSFDTNLLRLNFEGVANLRNVFNFDSFSDRIGLLGHAGVHYGFFGDGNDNGSDGDNAALVKGSDEVTGFVVGFTPQYRLSNTFVITADASFVKNYRQHKTWNYGTPANESNLNAEFMSFSLGVTAYLGKKETHADWYIPADKTKEELENVKNKLAQLEDKLNDKQDKMPDDDGNGIPNKTQNYINNLVKNIKPEPTDGNDIYTSMLEKEYVRIFFDFDEDMPNEPSADEVMTLIKYMKDNPDANVELIGLTDVLGTDSYNNDLSQRRAANVKDILVKSGIDASRISQRGDGKNPVFTSKDEFTRMFARTVLVKLK